MANVLRNGWGTLDWNNWIYGIGAGFIGGGASAVTSGVTLSMVDGNDFNIYARKFYVTVGAIFLVNGMMNMFMFLRQNPLPAVVTKTSVERTEHQIAPEATIVTRIEKTKTEPVIPVLTVPTSNPITSEKKE